MNLFQELRQRRVPQITSGYIVGSWGILQFLAFLESRMAISPHLVNLIGMGLLLLLPSLVILAWVHGKPGKDTWGRTPKVVISANVLAAGLLLGFLFSGRDLGAVTQTIAIEDEHGAVTERVIPKNEYRRRMLIFYLKNDRAPQESWTGETASYLLNLDLSQDGFMDLALPLNMPGTFNDADSPDGRGVPRPLQRKIARDAHIKYFLTGSVSQKNGQWTLMTELHETESGKVIAQRNHTATDLFQAVDLASYLIREDLDIPETHLKSNPDLPVADLASSDLEAVTGHMRGLILATHLNDWEQASATVEEAVKRDPNFALAQSLLAGINHTLGLNEKASVASSAAMENLYRVPERLSFMVKVQYYFNEKQDADKAMAVLRMWSQLYPNDVAAYEQQANFHFIRQDLPQAITAYEKILNIDPSRVKYLKRLADLYTQTGDFEAAENNLKQYIDIYPTRAGGYEDLSDFYSETGRLSEAREALAQAQLLEPENQDLALTLIDLDTKAARYSEVEKSLETMIEKADTARDRMRICGRQLRLASYQGKTDRAIERVEALYELFLETQNPLQANLTYSMALPLVSMMGRPEVAYQNLNEVKALIPDPYTDLVGVAEAWVLADLGRVAEARATLAKAEVVVETFKFETFRSSLSLVEGVIAERDNDLELAISHYRESIEKAIKVEPFYRQKLANVLGKTGQDDQALKVLEEGLVVEPLHPELQLEMAKLSYRQGDKAAAGKHLDIALAAWTEADADYEPAIQARQLADQLAIQ